MGDIEKARRARFKTAEEIEAEIDRQKALIDGLVWRAYDLDLKATYWFKKYGPKPESPQRKSFMTRAGKARERAAKMRQRADKIDGGHLTRLKSKLAVIRCNLLPGMGSDQSIPKR